MELHEEASSFGDQIYSAVEMRQDYRIALVEKIPAVPEMRSLGLYVADSLNLLLLLLLLLLCL